jgi:hypothetical protein
MDISTLADDTSISIAPAQIEMDRICHDRDEMKRAIDDYFVESGKK